LARYRSNSTCRDTAVIVRQERLVYDNMRKTVFPQTKPPILTQLLRALAPLTMLCKYASFVAQCAYVNVRSGSKTVVEATMAASSTLKPLAKKLTSQIGLQTAREHLQE